MFASTIILSIPLAILKQIPFTHTVPIWMGILMGLSIHPAMMTHPASISLRMS